MEAWDLCPTPNYHSLNFDLPCHSLDYPNPLLWDNNMGMNPESVLINQPSNICNEVCMDKELPWIDPSLSEGNIDEMLLKKEAMTVNSPMAGSSLSGFEEQRSETFVQDHKSKGSDENDTKKTFEGEEIADSKSKKRKKTTEKGTVYAFKTRCIENVLEDGYKWRKYGKKSIKSSPHPRSYYRCSSTDCGVKKRVERDPYDPTMLITTYEGHHNHESPSVIYYVGEPTVFQQPGCKPTIVFGYSHRF